MGVSVKYGVLLFSRYFTLLNEGEQDRNKQKKMMDRWIGRAELLV